MSLTGSPTLTTDQLCSRSRGRFIFVNVKIFNRNILECQSTLLSALRCFPPQFYYFCTPQCPWPSAEMGSLCASEVHHRSRMAFIRSVEILDGNCFIFIFSFSCCILYKQIFQRPNNVHVLKRCLYSFVFVKMFHYKVCHLKMCWRVSFILK